MIELLAPAGGKEALVAAVQSGADAVYMGLGSFNARRSARNFSDEEFLAAVRYCHLYGVKVYLTLNTLLTDRELPELSELARFASRCGVDAILVQDMGVFSLLQRVVPDVPLHASTQMSLHTLAGVKIAGELGCTRAVLARELSREEIAEICAASPIEIEVFVHGALCMCYSGQCEMSAVIGGRSGNRGMCAQPCRLPYGFGAKADRHPLSLKDSDLSAYLGELEAMGVACIKLEGRMKRPEYVAAVTGIYSRLLREHRAPTDEEERALALAFSRSGFTQGYYLRRRGADMFGTRAEDARWPEEWFGELRRAYEKEDLRTNPVSFSCKIHIGSPMELCAADDAGHEVRVLGAVPERARSRAVTREEAEERLKKTGGTAFTVSQCAISIDEDLSVPASALNALRRDALAALEEARCAVPHRREGSPHSPSALPARKEAPLITVSIADASQLSDELVRSAAIVYFPIELIDDPRLAPYFALSEFCAVLPRVYRTADETMLRNLLARCRALGVTSATVGELGHLELLRGTGMTMRGDFSLNVFNSLSLAFWRERGLSSAAVSFELHSGQIRDLQKCLPCEAVVYGRLPLMVTENCILANELGCKYSRERCASAQPDSRCASSPLLTDRKGVRFPVLRVFGCRNEIENAKTLFLADKPEIRSIGLTYARLRFTTESAAECLRVLRTYQGRDDCRPGEFTRGLFLRGVE